MATVESTPRVAWQPGFAEAPEEATEIRYRRYHIDTRPAPDRVPMPSRFRVQVKKHRLARLLATEMLQHRDPRVALSRPCMYGVFGSPVGGFAPREHLCVGCLRCTTQHPDVVRILPNPERARLGDSFFTAGYVDAVTYEAQTGSVPVKGAGYRGRFGGEGWDGLWTDMSEIVRPTRDGIHGREFISTVVDVGEKPAYLQFDEFGDLCGAAPRTLALPLPVLFDVTPVPAAQVVLAEAARQVETLAVVPVREIAALPARGPWLAPLVAPGESGRLAMLDFAPPLIEMAAWDATLAREIGVHRPDAILAVRVPFAPGFADRMLDAMSAGLRVFHLIADYHGRGADGRFALELIREAHAALVAAGCRDEVTLLGSGGIVAAEHVAKAILCGLDAVALDTPLLVGLQARLLGECVTAESARFELPELDEAWGVQRLKNLMASWRDQLLEVLGAMGIREARRMRGEMGRAMFQQDLEHEAFGGIAGYE